jgi:hypothetical protein
LDKGEGSWGTPKGGMAEYPCCQREGTRILISIPRNQLLPVPMHHFNFVDFGEIETDEVSFANKVAILEEGKDEAEDYLSY